MPTKTEGNDPNEESVNSSPNLQLNRRNRDDANESNAANIDKECDWQVIELVSIQSIHKCEKCLFFFKYFKQRESFTWNTFKW